VLGGFYDKVNAIALAEHAVVLLQEQTELSESKFNGKPYYRVVLPLRGRSAMSLKQRLRVEGFEDVWSYSIASVSMAAPTAQALPVALKQAPKQKSEKAKTAQINSESLSLNKTEPDIEVDARGSPEIRLSGYVKTYAVAQDALASDAFKVDKIYQSQNSARLMIESSTDNFGVQVHYELSPLSVSRTLGGGLSTYRIMDGNYRISDLESSLTDDPSSKTQVYQNLDRLNVQLQLDDIDITLGRQAVAFGSARFINPIDVFLPFDLRTFNTEYRTGVDAIRVQKTWGDMGEIDAGLVLGADANPQSSAAFLQLRNSVGGRDFNFSFIEFAEQTLVGGGVQSDLGSLGFWFEAAHVAGEQNYIRVSSGVDYAFSEYVFGMMEYHFNGAGLKDPKRYLSLYQTLPYQQGGVFLLGRQYLIPGLTVQASPLLSLSIQGIVNLTDDSSYTTVSAEYNIAENFYVDVGLYVFSGQGLSLEGGQTLALGSEYGGNPNTFYASLRWYF